MNGRRPLDGILMLEWAAFHNGPGAGYMLGDMGAEIIKVEEPVKGDPTRGMSVIQGDYAALPGGRVIGFETANRNKRSVVLDLKNDKGRQILYRLVEQADVFYTNYRPSLAQRLKLDYEALRQYNPKLIYATNSGYGPKGEDAEKRSFDQLGQARTGVMWAAGDRDFPEPVYVMSGIIDQGGATMLAYGIMAALIARDRLGVGQKVDVSQLGTGVHLQALSVDMSLLRGRSMARHSRQRSRSVFSNHYRCADNKWLCLAEAQQDRYWPDLCKAVGAEELISDPRYESALKRRECFLELNEVFERIFASKPRDEWMRIFKEQGCQFAYDVVNNIDDLPSDPQVLANGYIVPFNHPVLGPVRLTGFPVTFSETPCGISREAPELGQHTEEVLMERLGLSWEELSQLKEEGVI